jgi:hypothetical protein
MSLNEDTMVDPLRTDAPADLMHRPMFPNEPPNLVLPAPILFKDYGMAVPKKEIDLGNWSLLDQVHALLSCTHSYTLSCIPTGLGVDLGAEYRGRSCLLSLCVFYVVLSLLAPRLYTPVHAVLFDPSPSPSVPPLYRWPFKVVTLSLKKCDQIQDAGLVYLAACKNLTSLNLSGCTLITDQVRRRSKCTRRCSKYRRRCSKCMRRCSKCMRRCSKFMRRCSKCAN